MSDLSDMLLLRPVQDAWARWMLFLLFYLHLLFILMLIGTAIIGVHHFLHSFWTGEKFEERWDKKMLKKFIIPKAIGVALGTILLVTIQTYYAVPFYTATSMFAPYWLAAIPIMIFGFFFIDGISHKLEVHPYMSLVLGLIGLLLVLIIPGIFVVVLVTTEDSAQWIAIAQRGFRLPMPLSVHWFFRYLHIIGAGIVFGAAFQYLATTEGHEHRKHILVRWMVIGLLAQFVIGGLLALTLQQWIDLWTILPLLLGILCAVVLVWLLFHRWGKPGIHHLGMSGVLLLPILLFGMLFARQMIQQQKVIPLIAKLDANAQQWRDRLDPLMPQQLASYQDQIREVRDNGATIYERSCSFCHGRTGLGDGQERGHLITPPERLAYVRADPRYIYRILTTGVPGTAMPYFTIYESPRLEALMKYLGQTWDIYSPPGSIPAAASPENTAEAQRYFNGTCSRCHGLDGSGNGEYAEGLAPPPPDFRWYSLEPQRTFEVLFEGYPGTAMPSFRRLPEEVRWGLVQHVRSLRTEPPAAR